MTATLLDFDGVLVDSEQVHLAAFNDVLGRRGVRITEGEYFERYLSLDDAAVFRAALPRSTGERDDVRALVEEKSARFMARFADSFRVFPGATELIARRAERGPVAIVSGALEHEIEFALAKMGARDRVAIIVGAGRAPASKPDPSGFRLAMNELRDRGHEGRMVAVEDSPGGIAAAKGAGLRCVGVGHTVACAELLRAGADAAVEDLASLSDGLLEGSAR